jgi:hypothetical protein
MIASDGDRRQKPSDRDVEALQGSSFFGSPGSAAEPVNQEAVPQPTIAHRQLILS